MFFGWKTEIYCCTGSPQWCAYLQGRFMICYTPDLSRWLALILDTAGLDIVIHMSSNRMAPSFPARRTFRRKACVNGLNDIMIEMWLLLQVERNKSERKPNTEALSAAKVGDAVLWPQESAVLRFGLRSFHGCNYKQVGWRYNVIYKRRNRDLKVSKEYQQANPRSCRRNFKLVMGRRRFWPIGISYSPNNEETIWERDVDQLRRYRYHLGHGSASTGQTCYRPVLKSNDLLIKA